MTRLRTYRVHPSNEAREREKSERMLREDAYVDANGIYRWRSNDRVPHDDLLYWAGANDETRVAHDEVRTREDRESLRKYREAALARKRTPEEEAEHLYELRAAFGEGEEVVDVITGEVWRT